MVLKELKTNQVAIIMLIPCVVVLVMLTVYPIVYGIRLSLFEWNLLEGTDSAVFIGFMNYVRMFNDAAFIENLWTTLRFSITTVFIEFFIGMGLALLLDSDLKGRRLLLLLIMVPMVVAPICIGAIWRLLLHLERGHVNYFLSLIGINPVAWLSDPNVAFHAAVFVDIWKWSPLLALMFMAGLQAIPDEIYEAGVMDGASGFSAFRYLTFPMLKPYIAVALSIRLIDSFKTFDYLWILTSGGPGRVTELLNIYTYRAGMRHFEMGYASALSLFLMVLAAGSGLLMNAIMRRR